MAGAHSSKSLAQKLGLKPGYRVSVLNAPRDYETIMGELPQGVVLVHELVGPFDLIHFFTQTRKELEKKFPVLKLELSNSGGLWVSWPKASSGLETDLIGNIVREIGLKNGLVDVKIASINETWSALKFVYRLSDRT
jgi:hypothetical protein